MTIPTCLRSRLFIMFPVIFLIVLICFITVAWNASRVNTMQDAVMQTNLELYKSSRIMEQALVNQSIYLTSYFADGRAQWLTLLTEDQHRFQQSLDDARSLTTGTHQASLFGKLSSGYPGYRQAVKQAIEDYHSHRAAGFIPKARAKQHDLFFSQLEACRSINKQLWQTIEQAHETAIQRARQLVHIAVWAMVSFTGLFVLYLFILYRQILDPISDFARETIGNDALSRPHSFKDIMKDVGETRSKLDKSRRNLAQAERMAVVGELAAGVAHTIRNPLTSIKMRMFSLARSLDPSREQNDDLQVISCEIERIDKIVRNFLEFARPPKLRLSFHLLEDLVRSVANLMKYRLKKYEVDIIYDFEPGLSPVKVDSDRIREALLNLLTNSCEAMTRGGTIRITERREHDTESGEFAVLSILDDGPGIADAIRDKVTTPFFTTKENGSGLGLSSVTRIVEEHGGTFIITPIHTGCKIVMKLPL